MAGMEGIFNVRGRTYRDLRIIDFVVAQRFGGILSDIQDTGTVSVEFRREPVVSSRDLAAHVAKRHLEKDAKAMALFDQSLRFTAGLANANMQNPFLFTLNLDALVHDGKKRGHLSAQSSSLALTSNDGTRMFGFLLHNSALEVITCDTSVDIQRFFIEKGRFSGLKNQTMTLRLMPPEGLIVPMVF